MLAIRAKSKIKKIGFGSFIKRILGHKNFHTNMDFFLQFFDYLFENNCSVLCLVL